MGQKPLNNLAPPGNGLALTDRYGQFQIGGPLRGNAGFLDRAFDVIPGVGDYRGAQRLMQAAKPTMTPNLMGGVNVGMTDPSTVTGEALAISPMIGDAMAVAKAGAATFGPLIAMMAKRNAELTGLARMGRNQAGIIGSTGAKTADLGALKVAERMKAEGRNADEIYAQTRWWLDHPDGRPRFEIDDSGANLSGENMGYLPEVIAHKEVYKSYPDTKKIDTVITGSMESNTGAYTPFRDRSGEGLFDIQETIEAGKGGEQSTLLHEIQHAVQQRENLAKGGGSSEFYRELMEPVEEAEGMIHRFNNYMSDLVKEMDSLKSKKYIATPEVDAAIDKKIAELSDEYSKAMNEKMKYVRVANIDPIDLREQAFNKYKALAGEAEARLVQDRMNLTMDERLAPGNEFYKKFDVPIEDQIVRMEGGNAAMIGYPMDEASRVARADVDYPIEAYHGTNKDIKSFDPSKRGGATRAKSAQKAFWFTDDAPTTASGYADLAGDNEVQKLIDASQAAERRGDWDAAHNFMVQAEELDQVIGKGENVMPIRLGGKMKTVDMGGAKYDPNDMNLSKILDEAKAEGFEGVKFTNFSDEAGYGVYNPVTHYAVFDPKNIRSKFAKFDPAKKNSANLLAGGAAAAVGVNALADRDSRQ